MLSRNVHLKLAFEAHGVILDDGLLKVFSARYMQSHKYAYLQLILIVIKDAGN